MASLSSATPSYASSKPDWLRVYQTPVLVAMAGVAVLLRLLLAARSPTPYGYVYDFYHEAIQKFYALGRLPTAADCWQCYQPPLLPLVGLPFYAIGKYLFGGPGGLADPALRVVTIVSLVSGGVAAYYSYRILRFYRLRGSELVIGTGLILAFPCLFISSYGIEADILLTAVMTAFLYYALVFFKHTRPTYARALGIGVLAGLACETKYSGLLAPVILMLTAGLMVVTGADRRGLALKVGLALVVCAVLGSWKYIDNVQRHHTALFANGSAQQGFAATDRPLYWDRYDFHSLRLSELVRLVRGEIGPAHLTDLPFYRSVWTTLHAMAWGDMTMFSDPSRHGFYREPYPAKALHPWAAVSVLWLGVVPDALVVVGFLVSLRRRAVWLLAVASVVTSAAYIAWFLAQESWGLKTKYILFLLPAYALYAVLGWRWVADRSPLVGRSIFILLVMLLIAAHLYLLDFAWH